MAIQLYLEKKRLDTTLKSVFPAIPKEISNIIFDYLDTRPILKKIAEECKNKVLRSRPLKSYDMCYGVFFNSVVVVKKEGVYYLKINTMSKLLLKNENRYYFSYFQQTKPLKPLPPNKILLIQHFEERIDRGLISKEELFVDWRHQRINQLN